MFPNSHFDTENKLYQCLKLYIVQFIAFYKFATVIRKKISAAFTLLQITDTSDFLIKGILVKKLPQISI